MKGGNRGESFLRALVVSEVYIVLVDMHAGGSAVPVHLPALRLL